MAVANNGIADLELHLSGCHLDSALQEQRACATATLRYHPSHGGQEASSTPFPLVVPWGIIEHNALSWYVEQYGTWPWGVFKTRAAKIEAQLPLWGQALFAACTQHPTAAPLYYQWVHDTEARSRRFSIQVTHDETDAQAAARLLAVPWEILFTDGRFLFQGGEPVRVRRRIPIRRSHPPAPAAPLRILLVIPRADQGYFDHRIDAKPITDALMNLGELVQWTVLPTPTFPALQKELHDAKREKRAYHVVHFDGHGFFDDDCQLAGLIFEHAEDSQKIEGRRSAEVHAEQLAAELTGHGTPLFFLNACQTAQAEDSPTASVAAALLNAGVASVVAMSHSVLVVTARRFVAAFYKELARGYSIGEAMLAGQRDLFHHRHRFHVEGAGDLELQDWFVPVLYQESADPVLVARSKKNSQPRLLPLGDLPAEPEHGFVGRSRELLKLERILLQKNHAVIQGEGGEGKTALACELARWLATIGRVQRVAFVALELHTHERTVLQTLGNQLQERFLVTDPQAWASLTEQLQAQETLIILDNMESVLPPQAGADPGVFEAENWQALLACFKKLRKIGKTRLLFTSRETLPEPFANGVVRLDRLETEEAIMLVNHVLQSQQLTLTHEESGQSKEQIKALVESVQGHARSLVLLAPELVKQGMTVTTQNLNKLMEQLQRRFPNDRERSLFASLELSLRRIPTRWRQKIRVLGLFHGGANLAIVVPMLGIKTETELEDFLTALNETGLISQQAYRHLRFHPGLAAYLQGELAADERQQAEQMWLQGMRELTGYLLVQLTQDVQLSRTLTLLELPNLLAALERAQQILSPEELVHFANHIEQLLADLGQPTAMQRVVAIRTQATSRLTEWGNAQFEAERMAVERLGQEGKHAKALAQAQQLLTKTQQTASYPGSDYDLAMAYHVLGNTLENSGQAGQALPYLERARTHFLSLQDRGARMATISLVGIGNCFLQLGKLDDAITTYEQSSQEALNLQDMRLYAAVQFQLGTAFLEQHQFEKALSAYDEVRQQFSHLPEQLSVATVWHQMGMTYRHMRRFEEAESAYRQALVIWIREHNRNGEAYSLSELGTLYDTTDRLEEAVTCCRKAILIYEELGNLHAEGRVQNNLADTLISLHRFDEAQEAILRAIECKKSCGDTAKLWKSWYVLQKLEQVTGHPEEAEKARQQAMHSFLTYRRQGGENHEASAQLCAVIGHAIQEGDTAQISAALAESAQQPNLPKHLIPLLAALQKILAGSRDLTLADDPALDYDDACELILLLEALQEEA
ncbi:MAG: tetratricopeptide repeat protein [Magnetococcales bacterium]|nr:tetratricopeptide repeat protein [Magnetococcales bacterium]MBF0116936.1 tetratricopeptide repeat protein [Magnetococcales bacterium]